MLTDLMVHWIDVAHWLLDVDHPLKATAIGNHFASSDLWQTPDTIQCILEYPNNLQAHFEGTFSNATHGAMITFMGTDGTLYIDRGRYELTPEPSKGKPRRVDPRNQSCEGPGLLRQARRRALAPDELGRMHPQPEDAERSCGSRGERSLRGPSGQSSLPGRPGRRLDAVLRPLELEIRARDSQG